MIPQLQSSAEAQPRRSASRRVPFVASPAKRAHAALFALVIVGIGIRAATYLANRSIYIDEAALALSIRDRGWWALVAQPLDYAQTAPPGYLLLVKAAILTFGGSELAYRLPAFIAGCAAVVLFALLAWRVLNVPGALTAIALFSIARPLVLYATEAKPYAFDILVAVGVTLLAHRAWRRGFRHSDRLALAAVGIAAVTVSQAAVLILPAVGLALLWLAWGQNTRGLLATVAPAWVVAVVLAVGYASVNYTQEGRAYMQAFWWDGFFPLPPQSLADLLWLPRVAVAFGMDPFGSPQRGVPALIALAGVLWFWRRDRSTLLLLSAPIAITLIASALKLYPFGLGRPTMQASAGRVILFLAPAAFLFVGAAFGSIFEHVQKPRVLIAVGAIMLGVSLSVPTVAAFPYVRDDARGVLSYLARHRAPDEPIYVHYRGEQYMRFYAPRLGISMDGVTFGRCAMNTPREYVREWETMRRTGRAWFVFLHNGESDRRLLRAYLRGNGERVVGMEKPNAEAHLFRFDTSRPAIIPPTEFFSGPESSYLRAIACGAVYSR